MFGVSNTTTRSTFSPSYISDGTARRSAQGAYDAELAKAENPRTPNMGKGIGAGSGRRQFGLDLMRTGGMASASNAYQNNYMDAIEANRKARMQAESRQANEAAVLAGLAQDLDQFDFADRASEVDAQQTVAQAKRQRDLGALKTISSLLGGLLG